MKKYKNPECPRCKTKALYRDDKRNRGYTELNRGSVYCINCGNEWNYTQTIDQEKIGVREFFTPFIYNQNGEIVKGGPFVL